jgi:hypothetical protein
MKRIFILVHFSTIILLSCGKAEDRTCLKFTGNLDSLDVPTSNFNELFLGKRLNYRLVKDSVDYVRIKGGKNLLKSVTLTNSNNVLRIENKNRCDFLRDLGAILEVEIHYTNLNRVDGVISHNLITADTLTGDYFNLSMTGASGNAKIAVNTNFINGYAYDGSADYMFYGRTKFAHIQVYSNTFADIRDLQISEKLEITTRSSRAVFCHANGIPLFVNIESRGNVYYTGIPSSLVINNSGDGHVIKLD